MKIELPIAASTASALAFTAGCGGIATQDRSGRTAACAEGFPIEGAGG